MNKIRVIDLLNKIAKGEEVKYKYLNNTYREYSIQQFLENYFDANFNQIEDDYAWLNDEIEIIEEEKEIKKLNAKYTSQIGKLELANKIDEIIDELNKIKKEGK